MKHVTDQLPDIQVKRPEVSNALAAVIEKMTEKEPVDRYLTAASAVSDLEDVLAMESARAGGLTGEATIVFDSLPKRSRKLAPSGVSHPTRTKVAWLVAALAAVGIALLLVSQLESGSGGGEPSAKSTTGAVIPFKSTGSFDPVATGGDGNEHDEETHNAIDNNVNSDWTTEQYQGGVFSKPGIGLWGRTYKAATAATATVRTPDSSLGITIYGAKTLPADLAGWTILGEASGDVNGKRVTLEKVEKLRYYMVWITRLPPAKNGNSQAHISEFLIRN
jgi:serine/threonine-protein kinase